jgi:RNA-binding protein
MSTALTNAQTRFLRGQAHGLKAMLQVGGKGISDALVAEVDGALEHH